MFQIQRYLIQGRRLVRHLSSAQLGKDRVSFALGKHDGFVLETGILAPLADGAVIGHAGNNVLLATACADFGGAKEEYQGIQLVVDFRSKSASAAQIPSHVLRRELGPRESDIVIARMVDRALRPLFDPSYQDSTQLICTTLSFDTESADHPVLAVNTASAALSLADGIPWYGPLGCVRVGRRKGSDDLELLMRDVSPDELEQEGWDFSVVVAGKRSGLTMVDLTACKPVLPEEVQAAVEFAMDHINVIVQSQERLMRKLNKAKARLDVGGSVDVEEYRHIFDQARLVLRSSAYEDYTAAAEGIKPGLVDQLLLAGANTAPGSGEEDTLETYDESTSSDSDQREKEPEEEYERRRLHAEKVAESILIEAERDLVLKGVRRDGRRVDQTREISFQVNPLASTHGSMVTSMGNTCVLTSLTFGRIKDSLKLIPYCGESHEKRFMLQYELPPYSLNQVGRLGLNRRMIGDGDWAERAMNPVLPRVEDLPYAIRVTNETLGHDGSSIMAALVGTSAALLTNGVQMETLVTGVSIGLIWDERKNKKLYLTDVTGSEEDIIDMELKIAGTREGLTSLQMSVKAPLKVIPLELFLDGVQKGKTATDSILDDMAAKIAPGSFPAHAPRSYELSVGPGEARRLIGAGGSIVRALETELDVEIDIDADKDIIVIYSRSESTLENALERIRSIFWEPSVGEVFECEVVEVQPFGAAVVFSEHRRDGWLHISEYDVKRMDRLDSEIKVGDKMQLQVLKVENGRVRLSRRALMLRNPSAPKARLPRHRGRALRSAHAKEVPPVVDSQLNFGGNVPTPPPSKSDFARTRLKPSPLPPPPPPPDNLDSVVESEEAGILRRIFGWKTKPDSDHDNKTQ